MLVLYVGRVCSTLVRITTLVIFSFINFQNLVDAFVSKSCCQSVQKIEPKYRPSDIAVEEQLEKLVIHVTSIKEETDTAVELDESTDSVTEETNTATEEAATARE